MRRDQGCVGNHHKIMHTSAKHYFEVVWTHLGAFRAVKSTFPMIFRGFPRFWESRPARLALSRPRPAEQSLSEDFEDFIISERGFGSFYENLQDSQRI